MTIRVCIGTEEKTEIPCRVLQHSILKNTQSPVEFFTSNDKSWKNAQDRPYQIGTGFSLYRWQIPELMKFEGHAIYLDADQLVFADIKELWRSDITYPNRNTAAWCTTDGMRSETSVMYMNCEKMKEQMPSMQEICSRLKDDKDRTYYRMLMHGKLFHTPPQYISNYWNHLNTYEKGKTRLLHYTVERSQPWYVPEHSLTYLWEEALRDAIDAKFVTKEMIKDHCSDWKPRTEKDRFQGMNPYYLKYA